MAIFPDNTEAEEDAIYIRDHLCAWVEDGEMVMAIDNYVPDSEEAFDQDIFEAHSVDLRAPANRDGWQLAYRIARALIRYGSAVIACPTGNVSVNILENATVRLEAA